VNHLTLRTAKKGRRRGTIFGDVLYDVLVANEVGAFEREEYAPADVISQSLDRVYEELAETGNLDAAVLAELEVERIKVEVMATKYIERYGMDSRRELKFDLPLVNPRTKASSRAFRRGGKIDGVVVVGDKKVRIVEDKFVAQIQRAMIERLPLDHQATEYVDAFLARGWDAEVSYRHTRVPGKNPLPPKQFKTKDDYPGETLDEYFHRLMEDVEENPDAYFDEQILIFPKKHLEDYRLGRWGVAQQIIAARKQLGSESGTLLAYPMSPTRCWEYGGCEFIPLCTKREDAEALYEVVEDNPELNTESITEEYANAD
jgi:hypothetical protein